MTNIAKITVEKFDSKEEILYEFDKTKGLEYNIETICRKVGVPPETKIYGLKFLPTKTSDRYQYVSTDNYTEIKHNDCLKLVFSINYIIERIVANISVENLDLRRIAFEDISKHCLDPVFIEQIVLSGVDEILIKTFIEVLLTTEEQLGLLKTIVHLFSKNYILDTKLDILWKALKILKISDTTAEELRFTLSLLHKILISTNPEFDSWKEIIIKEVPIKEINQLIWRESESAEDLQYSALLLINTIIKISKGDKKLQLIKEMNFRKTRENIYNFIIMKGNLNKNMEHELYVLQTYLLGLFREALQSKINIDENTFFKRDEFDLGAEDMRRITILMDFDEANNFQQSHISVEDLACSSSRNSRISIASFKSANSSRMSSTRNYSWREISEDESSVSNSISHLTLEALRHFKNLHPKNFYQSQIEEKLYEPGIFSTSERIVNMLAKMFHIGVDPPDSRSTFYQPVVFYCSSKTPFFLELFSRTMWLLSRTRREMKASSYADYEKVMYILQKQVKTALKLKPKDFKSLTLELTNTSFQSVMEKIHKDKEEEMQLLLETHPCIQELKIKYLPHNEEVVFNQRMEVLLKGGSFPKVLEKKISGSIFIKLSKNKKELLLYNSNAKTCSFSEKFLVDDITHVVIGKNCQHSNLTQNSVLAFCVIIKHELQIKFIAENEKTANYWTDALFLLLGKATQENLSKYYKEELKQLIEMDIRLQLLELQNVQIPKQAPPIPRPPITPKPELPPKPKNIRKNRSKNEY